MKRSTRVRTVVILLVLLSTQAPVWARGGTTKNIPAALVVDPCRSYTDPGEPLDHQVSEVTLIDFLSDGPTSSILELNWVTSDPKVQRGATFASLPKYSQSHVFVTRGGRLDVYYVGKSVMGLLVLDRIRSVSVGGLIGVSGLQLGRVTAGGYVPAEAEPGALFQQASVYVIASRPGHDTAYYAVIDQQWLIEGAAPTSTVVYDYGPICSSPTGCVTTAALDIRVGEVGNIDFTEEAYITTVENFGSTDLQMTYRLERRLGLNDFTLSPYYASYWKDATNPIDPPLVPDASGLRFADDSRDVYVPRKFEWTVRNLNDGTESCVLPGEPTDVAVWEPRGTSAVPRYLLTTSWDGSIGRLDVFPAGQCPIENPPSTLSVMIGAEPTSLDVYPVGQNELWVLVASKGARLFEAIRLELESSGGIDTFEIVETRTHDMLFPPLEDSCPSFVQFGMREETPWVCPLPPPGGCTGIDRKCLRNDPRCE